MPIQSFNITESMKIFLKKMVGSKKYKSNSNVLREALIRLMDEKDSTSNSAVLENSNTNITEIIPKLSSSILVTLPKNISKIEKKINRIEMEFQKSILEKSILKHDNLQTITYILKDNMINIQDFVNSINSIDVITAFRYSIHEPHD